MLIRFFAAAIIFFLLNPALADDGRQTVQLPDMMREHMLSNMRDHLLALEEITRYLANQQYDKAPRLLKIALACHRRRYMVHLTWVNSCPKKWVLLERICIEQQVDSLWPQPMPRLKEV